MFYHIREDSDQAVLLKSIFQRELEREQRFRKRLCKILPPFDGVLESPEFGNIFPQIAQYRLVGVVDPEVWETDLYKGYYYPNTETQKGVDLFSLIIDLREDSYDTLKLYNIFGMPYDRTKEFRPCPMLYVINNEVYVYFEDYYDEEFTDKWHDIATHTAYYWFTQLLLTCDYKLIRSNMED